MIYSYRTTAKLSYSSIWNITNCYLISNLLMDFNVIIFSHNTLESFCEKSSISLWRKQNLHPYMYVRIYLFKHFKSIFKSWVFLIS